MKKVVSLLLALTMAAGMSVAAMAADYSVKPDYSSDNDRADTSTSVGESASKPASTVSSSFINDLISNGNSTVHITVDAKVDQNALNALKKSDTPVKFEADGYVITIDPSKIANVPAGLKLGMDVKPTSQGVSVIPAAKGSFGLTMEIALPVSAFDGMDTEKLKVYYKADDGKIYDLGKVKIKGDNVEFSITHASEYVLTDKPMEGAIVGDVKLVDGEPNPSTGAANVPAIAGAVALLLVAGAAVAKKSL